MTAFASISQTIESFTGGASGAPETIGVFKDSRVGASAAAATIAGRWTSLWQYNGQPAHGSAPGGTARIPDNTTDGGIKQTDPGGSRQKWISGTTMMANAIGTLVLYDRLLDISGLSGTSTSAQTVGGTLGRYTSGEGNQIWIEIYTQIGASSTTITASYTDQGGNSGSTTQATAIGNTGLREAQRLIQLPLAAGDTGVQAVASVTLAATTGTAGDFGVTIMRPLLWLPCPVAGVAYVRNCVASVPGFAEAKTDACLAWAWFANGTTSPQLFGDVRMAER